MSCEGLIPSVNRLHVWWHQSWGCLGISSWPLVLGTTNWWIFLRQACMSYIDIVDSYAGAHCGNIRWYQLARTDGPWVKLKPHWLATCSAAITCWCTKIALHHIVHVTLAKAFLQQTHAKYCQLMHLKKSFPCSHEQKIIGSVSSCVIRWMPIEGSLHWMLEHLDRLWSRFASCKTGLDW